MLYQEGSQWLLLPPAFPGAQCSQTPSMPSSVPQRKLTASLLADAPESLWRTPKPPAFNRPKGVPSFVGTWVLDDDCASR